MFKKQSIFPGTLSMPEDPEDAEHSVSGARKKREGDKRMNTWKETAESLTKDFMAWGCPFSRKQLPGIAMAYDCTPLFFWNWLDGETDKSEKGFLRVLGYAWRKAREEEAQQAAGASVPQQAPEKVAAAGKRIAA